MTWWFLIFVFTGCCPQLLLHELSHYVVYRVEGVKVLSFKPYPHKHEQGWSWGRIVPEKSLTVLSPVSNCAPMLKGMLMALVWTIASYHWWHLWPLAAWEVWDVVFWWWGWRWGSPRNDGKKMRLRVEDARRR
jgi:hypothetical protein